MAKVTGPLHSDTATGLLGSSLRYVRNSQLSRVRSRRSVIRPRSLGQRQQASIVSAIGASWRQPANRPEYNDYRLYVSRVTMAGSLFWTDSLLMVWTADQILSLYSDPPPEG